MRTWHRTLGIAAVLITLALAAGWVARPDLHDRVRLTQPASHPFAVPDGQRAGAIPSVPPCTQADLDAWQMPTPPDAASRHVTLYSDRTGAKRAEQGEALVPGVLIDSVTPTQVTLVCAGGRARRQLTSPQPASPTPSTTRLPAPLGN